MMCEDPQRAGELSEETPNRAQEFASIGGWVIDIPSGVAEWSHETYRIFGVPDGEPMTAERFLACVHPEDRQRVREAWRAALGGAPYAVEHRLATPDGGVRWVRELAELTFSADGQPLTGVGTAQDITASRRAAETMRIMGQAIRASLSPLVTADPLGLVTSANPAFLRLWGYDHESEVLGRHAAEFWQVEEQVRAVIRSLTARSSWAGELAARRKDGSAFDVQLSASALRDEAGGLLGLVAAVVDITERQEARQDLAYRQSLLEQVIHLGKHIAAINDLDRCLRAIHRSFHTNLGFDRIGVFLYERATRTVRGTYGTSRAGLLEDISWYRESAESWAAWRTSLQSPSGMNFVEDYQATYNPPVGNEMYGVGQHVTLVAWTGDTPVALITIDNLISGRPITIADLEAIQFLAGYVGLAIENARLNTGLEQRVRERTAEVQDLYDSAPNGYHSLDARGTVVMINQTELSWLGYAREEVVGVMTFRDLLAPQSRPVYAEAFARFPERGAVNGVELDLMRKDGSLLPVLLSATAVYGADGAFLQSRSTILDVTTRRAAEEALRESQASLQNFLDTASDLIQRLDKDGNYTYVNRAWCGALGYTVEEARGMNMLDVIAPEYHEHCRALLVELATTGRSQDFEVIFRTRDGRSVIVEGGVSIHTDSQGRVTTNGIFRDITMRKQAEEALRRSRDELSVANTTLERAARMKDEFLANMSHELRTPLNAILTFSESLLEQYRGPLNGHQRAWVENIEASGRHLLSLINDILDLSKVEAGQMTLQLQRVPISDLCQASLMFVREIASKKSLRLGLHLSDHLLEVEADPKRLKQMLVNLLSNAVKFTPAGGTVCLEAREDAAAGAISFVVQDTGIGIAPDDLSRLFLPFTQLDSSLSRQQDGTGLGLALVRRLTELHGGSITVESALGTGSRFTITLPYSAPAAAERPAAAAGAQEPGGGADRPLSAGARVLLAEDNELSMQATSDYLGEKGLRVTAARNGQEALSRAAEARPDVILMDVQMPIMDGLEAMRRLRASPAFAATPIIALTALAMPGDRERCLAAGADAYLLKPVNLRELGVMIESLLRAPRPTGREGFGECSPPPEP